MKLKINISKKNNHFQQIRNQRIQQRKVKLLKIQYFPNVVVFMKSSEANQ